MSDIDWPKWIRSWPCIDEACDGAGTVVNDAFQHENGEVEYDLSQCQFCCEREYLAEHVERLTAENERKTRLLDEIDRRINENGALMLPNYRAFLDKGRDGE